MPGRFMLLRVGEGEAAVDLERLAAFVSAVGLDEGVVDALGLEPGEQEVPELVGADGVGEPGGVGVAGEHGPDPAGAVGLSAVRVPVVRVIQGGGAVGSVLSGGVLMMVMLQFRVS